MEDIENSDVTADRIITIVVKVKVTGSDGSIMYFVPFYQYIFCDTAIMAVACNSCVDNAEGSQAQLHYKVCVGSVVYWVPSYAAVIEGRLRTAEQQDFKVWFENKIVDQPRDWKEEYKNCTGITIGIGESEHNGYEIWKKHLRVQRIEHKIPGE